MPIKVTTESFIEKSRKVHGDKYDYSKTIYKGCTNKVCIICPEHGEFWQLPTSHMSGNGCPKCFKTKYAKTTEEFVCDAKKIHGDKYDYSKVEYKNAHTKVCIVCPEHGEFWQKPNSHLSGCGCPKCGDETISIKQKNNKEDFIKKSRTIHGDKYDYSKVEYVDSHTKVCIICPEHGEFWQTPYNHYGGKQGCPKCGYKSISIKKKTVTTEEWIKRAKEIHGNRYSYDKTIYTGYRDKVIITCPIHGDFEQLSYDHLQGKGCPKCRKSRMEVEMSDFLTKNGIEYTEQYRPKFLNLGKSRLSLDFYLPEYNAAIECQGAQHFIGNTFYSQNIENIIERDSKKEKLCNENGIKIFYYTNLKEFSDNKENLYICKEKLLEEIKNERVL